MPARKGGTEGEGTGVPKKGRNVVKTTVFRVDRLCRDMAPEDYQEFLQFCRQSRSVVDIQRWLKDQLKDENNQPVHVPLAEVQAWYYNRFPTGKEAEYFHLKADEAQGVDPARAQEWLLTRIAKLTSDAYDRIFNDAVVEALEPQELTVLTTNLSREMKTLATNMQAEQSARSRRDFELAGAYRMVELIEQTVEKTPIRDAVQAVLKACLEQVEAEIKSAPKPVS